MVMEVNIYNWMIVLVLDILFDSFPSSKLMLFSDCCCDILSDIIVNIFCLVKVLTKYQRNQSSKPPKGQEGQVVLSERQASQTVHFQVIP